jgi:signal peptidase I
VFVDNDVRRDPPDLLPPPAAEPAPPAPAPEPDPVERHPVGPPPPLPPVGFTVRRFVHVLTLFFSLFLVVRTTFVEPFGVTTGSMAETIHGNRREAPCPRCGAHLCVGSPDERRTDNPQDDVTCPNCGLRHIDLTKLAGETLGDRLMVDKLVYRLRPPRRWEVAVFRCPVDDQKPYVKRVVGLPGEAVRLFDGDVYADGVLQRKTLPQVRETRIPVFLMDHPPRPDGWAIRWEVGPVVDSPKLPPTAKRPLPKVVDVVQDTRLVLDATAGPVGLTYRHRDPDASRDDVVRDRIVYNGAMRREWVPVHDFQLECEVEVVSATAGRFAIRLGDGADTVKADLPIHHDPHRAAAGSVEHEGGRGEPLPAVSLAPGQRHHLEFAFVDRRVTLAVDGREVLPPLDLPAVKPGVGATDPAGKRRGLDRPLQLGVSGAHVVLHHLTLHRDIHYRSEEGKFGTREQYRLPADEYFLLGDNTANSQDSREWEKPGVPERHFLGKPFLVHQPLKAGRLPVLGRVQTIDWERFRLLE